MYRFCDYSTIIGTLTYIHSHQLTEPLRTSTYVPSPYLPPQLCTYTTENWFEMEMYDMFFITSYNRGTLFYIV